MATPAHLKDLERRKQVRIRLRPDLIIAPQKYEGKTYYVVKDPVSLRYYRFKEQEHFLLRYMDGRHTLDQAQKEYEVRFRPERLTLEDLEQFAQQLLTVGLAQNESPQAGKQLFDRRKKRRRTEWMQALTNILYIKIPVYDPDRLLTWMLQYTRWIFTNWFLLISVAVMLAAILLVATHFQTFLDKLPSYHEFFSFKTIIYLWIALGVVKIIHEFGHGLSCKAFGGEVHEMGALFLCLSPCLYCNVSDAWTLPNKWHRIIISAAGIYVELIIAALATFIWWNTPGQPFINNLSLSLMVVCSISTVIFNANPLMRFDGYYVLADWLEIPNLRDRSNRFLQRVVMEYCLGIEVQPEPYMSLGRRTLFITYAIVSYIYRWVITFSILWFMYTFLKPYKLGAISAMLAWAAAGSMVGWPLYRLGKNLHKRGRLPDMKPLRVTLSSAALVAVLLFILLIPLPVSRVRDNALVQVSEKAVSKVFVQEPGILERLDVKDGQRVTKGQVLAKFRNLDLELRLQEALTQREIQENVRTRLEQQKKQTPPQSQNQISELEKSIQEAKNEWYKHDAEVRALENQLDLLVIRAPRDGIVMNPPRIDDIGKLFEKEQPTPFCSVGDPTQLQALLPVSPADYDLLARDRRELMAKGSDLGVTLRVQGLAERTWTGKVKHLPQAEAKEIPVQLSNKGGGNLAVKPDSRPGVYRPQNQVYLVTVEFLESDPAICPGTMAQVKIHCHWRTGAWWLWRAINSTFELGLI